MKVFGTLAVNPTRVRAVTVPVNNETGTVVLDSGERIDADETSCKELLSYLAQDTSEVTEDS